MSNSNNRNKHKVKDVHPDDTLMDRLGRENVLPDGLLFEVDDTQRISGLLAVESIEKPLDIEKE